MLHKETIENATLELLIKLQGKSYLQDFYLVGGTALALLFGHRKSDDIGLFSDTAFDTGSILEQVSADFPFKLHYSAKNTLKGSIDQVQVDLIAHRYPMVNQPEKIEGIRMWSLGDLIAMKLNAITVSGERAKDFIDIYYLLDHHPMDEMIHFYEIKYASYSTMNVLKSLIWFDDVNLSAWPVMLKHPTLKWETITRRISRAVKQYLDKTKDQRRKTKD